MKKEEQAPGTERVSVTLVVDFAGFGKPAKLHVEECPPEGLSEGALQIRIRLFGAIMAGFKKEFGPKKRRK